MAIMTFKAMTEISMTEGMQTTCTARNMSFVLDEPPSLGGTDKGMNPVEALLSALGACKCIVAKSFAKMKDIDLKEVRIECEGDLDPDGFMGVNKDAKIGFSRIKTNYYIEAANTEDEIKKFIKFIESNCPVNDTIVNTPVMEHELHIK